MKKAYKEPACDVICFLAADIICTSNDSGTTPDPEPETDVVPDLPFVDF